MKDIVGRFRKIFLAFAPFWFFLVLFKFGGALHYSLLSPLGEQLLPIWVVGFVMGGASFVQLILDVPAGRLLDRFGYRRLLKITALLFVVAALCLAFKFTLAAYFMSVFLSIFAWLFFGPGVNAYLLSIATKEEAGKFMSFRDVFNSTGVVIASGLLPFVLLFVPTTIGLFLTGLFVLALIAISLAPKDQVSVHLEKKLPTHHYYIRREFLSSFKAIRKLNPASTMLLLLNTASGIFYGIIWFTVPLVLAHEANNMILGIGLGIFDFAVVALGFVLGSLADKVNKRTLIFFGLLIFSICGMMLGFGFGWLFILFGFLATAGEEMAGLSLWSWLHALDRDHANDGAVSGIINLFEDFGWMIGPVTAGLLYGLVGPSWTIVIGAAPIFILWFIYWFFFQKHTMPHMDLSLIPAQPRRRRHKG